MSTSKLFVMAILTVVIVILSTNVMAERPLSKGEFLGASFDAMDIDNDGKISRNEYMKKYEERFDIFDVNDDGYVTKEEVMKTARPKFKEPKEIVIQKAKMRFDYIDTDNDGKISKEEWISDNPNRPEAEETFDQIDTDGDGYLTKEELKGMKRQPEVKRGKGPEKKD